MSKSTLKELEDRAVETVNKVKEKMKKGDSAYDTVWDLIHNTSWEVAGAIEDDNLLALAGEHRFVFLRAPGEENEMVYEGLTFDLLSPRELMFFNVKAHLQDVLIERTMAVCPECGSPIKFVQYGSFEESDDTEVEGFAEFQVKGRRWEQTAGETAKMTWAEEEEFICSHHARHATLEKVIEELYDHTDIKGIATG